MKSFTYSLEGYYPYTFYIESIPYLMAKKERMDNLRQLFVQRFGEEYNRDSNPDGVWVIMEWAPHFEHEEDLLIARLLM